MRLRTLDREAVFLCLTSLILTGIICWALWLSVRNAEAVRDTALIHATVSSRVEQLEEREQRVREREDAVQAALRSLERRGQ